MFYVCVAQRNSQTFIELCNTLLYNDKSITLNPEMKQIIFFTHRSYKTVTNINKTLATHLICVK